MDAVNGDDTGEVLPEAGGQRGVLISEEQRCAAVCQTPPRHGDGILAHDGVPPGGIELRELLHIQLHQLGVALCGPADAGHLGEGGFINLPLRHKGCQPLGVGHIVKVAVLLPAGIGVGHPVVVVLMGIHGISGEDEIPVHERINHHHDDGNHNANRDDASQNPEKKVTCHGLSSLMLWEDAHLRRRFRQEDCTDQCA